MGNYTEYFTHSYSNLHVLTKKKKTKTTPQKPLYIAASTAIHFHSWW